MNIGTTANDFGLVIVLMLGALLALGLLFGLGALIGKLVGGKARTVAPLFMVAVVIAIFYGGSLYMDSAGQVIEGVVSDKNEQIRIRRQGDWQHRFEATVQYRLDGRKPDGDQFDPDLSSVGLSLNAGQFDELREQQTASLRILPLWRTVTLVRLSSVSTRDLVPLSWIIIGVGLLALGWLILRFGKTRLGCSILALIIFIVGLGLPSAIIYRDWQAMEDLGAKPLRAQASVSAVRRVTQIDPLPCYNRSCKRSFNSEFDVPQQYDIVQFSFTPANGRDAVIGVDAADAGTFNGQVGDTVEIAYNASDPRAVQIIGATHSHHWKNLLMFVAIMGGSLLIFLVVVLLFGWVGRRSGNALKRARQHNAP